MAFTVFRFHVFLVCLVIFGTTTTHSSTYWRGNNEHRPTSRDSADSSFDVAHELYLDQYATGSPSRDALPMRSGNYAARGRKSLSNNGLLKHSILDYYRLLLDMIRNPFARKQVHDQGLSKAEHGHNVLFVFGDSLFDAGNNVYINDKSYFASNYPYGYTHFNNATGRVSDGLIAPDFIAEYANLPLIPPSLQPGADFAYGANFASTDSTVLNWNDNDTINMINLKEQVRRFKAMVGELNQTLGPHEAAEMLRRAVYLFSIGGNDYVNYYELIIGEDRIPTHQAEQDQFVKDIIGNITNALIDIYELGARKIAFQNVGPLGCLPVISANLNWTCAQLLLSMPALHNEELYKALTNFAQRLEGFRFSVMDYYTALYDRITDPSNYGFDVGKTECYISEGDSYRGAKGSARASSTLCEYPSAYVFFDEAHTTERANEQMAKLIWSGDPSVTRPYNVKQLFQEDY